MDAAAAAAASETPIFNRSTFTSCSNPLFFVLRNPLLKLSPKFPPQKLLCNTCCTQLYNSRIFLLNSNKRAPFRFLSVKNSFCMDDDVNINNSVRAVNFVEVLVRRGLAIAAAAIGVVAILSCRRALAVEGVMSAGYGVWERSLLALRSSLPKVLQVLTVFKEQGLVLAALLGLSAFFSMAETSITTLWPWKVRELAEKESENGVFKMLRNDVTRFLTTILIGTTVVNIGATALVTEAATAIFGEAGVSAATGVMTGEAASPSTLSVAADPDKLGNTSKTQTSTLNLPPGPRKIPFIGNMHLLVGHLPHHALRDLAVKYGPLMHLQLGEVSTVVVSSPDMAKEVMTTQGTIFACRPEILAAKVMSCDCLGIVFAPYGNYWRQLRKICTADLLGSKSVHSFRSLRGEVFSDLSR